MMKQQTISLLLALALAATHSAPVAGAPRYGVVRH